MSRSDSHENGLVAYSSKSPGAGAENASAEIATKQLVLARGIVGDAAGIPKVACPLHKKTFSLETGECLTGDELELQTFPVKVEEGRVYLRLPVTAILEQSFTVQGGCSLTQRN